MAITIKIEPQELQPVYNQLMVVLDSTNKSKENYQFIVEVNIAGVSKSRLKIQPNPDGYGVVDIHKHVEPYVSFELDHDNLIQFRNVPNMFTEYDITLSEEYIPTINITNISIGLDITTSTVHGFVVGNTITILNSDISQYNQSYKVTAIIDTLNFTVSGSHTSNATSGEVRLVNEPTTTFASTSGFTGDKYAFNGVENWVDVPNWDFTDYQFSTSGDASFLTTMTQTGFTMTQDSRMWFNMYNKDSLNAEIDSLIIEKFQNGTSGGSVNMISGGLADPFIGVGVGVWNINNSDDLTVSGNPNFLAGADSYSITGVSVSGSEYTSKTYTFKIKDECNKYESYQILFMDRLGSFIPATFDLVSKKNVTVKKTTYKKVVQSYNPATNTWGYNNSDREISRLDTRVDDIISITSNWVTESQARIIDQIYTSPQVFHLDEDGNLFAINILNSDYTERTRVNDQIFNYELRFEYSFKNNQQK